jgi:ABC-type antimicrobial peptide transport system permease subunit
MRISEIGRLVWINLVQNKTKVLLTSVGIIVGSATIMLVIAIGTGGKEEVAEQFKNLNAGAIDISYDSSSSTDESMMFGGGGGFPGGGGGGFSGGGPGGGPGGNDSKNNQDKVTLSDSDIEDIEAFVPGISSATLSFSTTSSVDGGELEDSTTYTIAGVESNYADMSNLTMAIGDFLTDENNELKEKECVLGYDTAKTIFGSVYDAYDGTVYIDSRPYTVAGVLSQMGTVASGISPDSAIYIPYNTGVKYLTGSSVSPTITVIAEDVNNVSTIKSNIEEVLTETYPNAEFTLSDAGSKMEAASKSNETLTLLLYAMAAIVFIVGGIGIMNVLFVSVKERTNEIGILKAIGCSRKDILMEFLMEAMSISLVGAIIGVMAALAITPLIEQFGVRVSLSFGGAFFALMFGIFTGSVFGFYPAYKASRLIPVEALNAE